MSHSIICSECEAELTVPNEVIGKKIRCKNCGHAFKPEAPSNADAAPTPRKTTSKKRPRVVEPDDEVVTATPRESRLPVLIIVGVIGLLGLGFIGGLAYALGRTTGFIGGNDQALRKTDFDNAKAVIQGPLMSDLKIGSVPELKVLRARFRGEPQKRANGDGSVWYSVDYQFTDPNTNPFDYCWVIVRASGPTVKSLVGAGGTGRRNGYGSESFIQQPGEGVFEIWMGLRRPNALSNEQPQRVSDILTFPAR